MSLVALALLLGTLLPLLIAVVQQEHWSTEAKTLVALVLAAIAAGVTVWGRGDWTGLNQASVDALGTAFGALIATTWGSYHALWVKLGVAQWIERVTTFAASHKTVVEQVLDVLAGATPEDKAKVAAALTPQQIS